ncbi:ABC transporter ATP-binding protein [Thermoflavimicrobium dichotomicum]|uniref:Peptide/nickel transport system ATP-binding protein/oligopeptide transport system ATP-binding protein n=1 Tax=Thermoflavimicrobium dichotomicum TaxID=46223 RepID=A0A1I3LQB7_9BACL|nr:dipeptide ABC transporter ATP-binding protein [Thermoflavimicrobium dichotomicum]SFI86921.1 peptide/nickel transport system ATP-binding protein/oligopeptide transport system ATP-binding protein [Thermoflavimicrobium dichotomicum]
MSHLLEVKNLCKYFPIKSGFLKRTVRTVKAVDDVTFYVKKGETFGLVGESGCGKSTTGRAILRLIEPTSGEVWFDGNNIAELPKSQLRKARRHMQMVFQDPYASLNPQMSVAELIEEPLKVHQMYASAKERKEKVLEIAETVGLNRSQIDRYPHEFSGGQRQRIGIARALSLQPKLIIADEPVSALDVSIQSQVINLMEDLQEEFGLTYIFIAHDLSVVKHISDRVGVMYLGRMVEMGTKHEIYDEGAHPYTQALLSAVPIPNPKLRRERIVLKGDVPNPANPPTGCAFHPRCPKAFERCKQERPQLTHLGGEHYVACHLYDNESIGHRGKG